jgi:hypothetical protein
MRTFNGLQANYFLLDKGITVLVHILNVAKCVPVLPRTLLFLYSYIWRPDACRGFFFFTAVPFFSPIPI